MPTSNGPTTADEADLLVPTIDTSKPNIARVYDYLLGGKDNFHADREAARQVLAALPHAARACRDNRDFLQRAVRYLAGVGVRQFLDIGTGLPTMGAVHEVAQEIEPGSRVAYVDNDPIVLSHARALLATSPGVAVAEGDLTDPNAILASPQIRAHLDFSRPVAVLLLAVVHFVGDAHAPHKIVQALMDATALGSYLAITHVTADHVTAQASTTAREVYADSSAGVTPHTRAQVTGLFDGLELAAPGVVDITRWHLGSHPARPMGGQPPPTYMYGGIAVTRR